MTLSLDTLARDLGRELPHGVRMQRLVEALRLEFRCGAVALLQLDADYLRPVAVAGLVSDALGRRFQVGQHPRLAAILARPEVTCFHHDTELPDPYDGLIGSRAGEPLPVHDCMGASLVVDGKPWGALTLDSLEVGVFDVAARERLNTLLPLVEASVRLTRMEAEVQALRMGREDPGNETEMQVAGELIGESPVMQRLLHELKVVADSELPVLLTGETGVGKELFAHRLHRLSRRRNKPMVHVNCAALPESLAESELFGHMKGAFSGAVSERPGRFEAADGGTLFLDEVGELPLAVQAKLLRTLQNGEIQRLGADRPKQVNVRIIAATNRDLKEQVREGNFRADLYHRLSVYPVPIPPLRERGQDILLLGGRFLELNRARLGLRGLRLGADAEEAMLHYTWPGNVRELEHVISRAALRAFSRGASRRDIVTIHADMLDLDGTEGLVGVGTPRALAPPPVAALTGSMRQIVEGSQRAAIEQALARHQSNWARAARELEVDPSNLHKLAKRLGIKAAR